MPLMPIKPTGTGCCNSSRRMYLFTGPVFVLLFTFSQLTVMWKAVKGAPQSELFGWSAGEGAMR